MPRGRRIVIGCAGLFLLAVVAAGAAAAPEDGFVAVAGGKLGYDVSGQGRSVVLVHDGLLPSVTWDEQVGPLAARFRVVRYDRRGYGRSETATRDYSDVEDLRAVLDHVGAARADLVGCSSGGALVLDFALAYPDRVGSLVLVGPVLSGFGYSEHFIARNVGNARPLLVGKDDAAVLDRRAADPYLTDARNVAARRRLRELLGRFPQSATRKIQRSSRPEPDSRGKLGQVTAPVLLVVGESDIPDVHAHVGAIAAGIRHAQRAVIPQAGHLVHMEQPAAFNERVLEFLDPRAVAERRMAAGLGEPATPEARKAFDYDPSAPLDLQEKGVDRRGDVRVRDVSYASPLGGRVPAYLVEPGSLGRHGGVLFLHHGQGDRKTFLEEAVALAGRGLVSLLIDAPEARPADPAGPSAPPFDVEAERREIVQTVVDLRRGFDLLASRPNVDPGRMAYVGYSLGATMGARLAGLEPRATGFVLVAGFPALSEATVRGHSTVAAAFRALLDAPAQAAYERAIGPLDGTHFLGRTAPLLLQFARADEYISPVDVELFGLATAGRSDLRRYDGGHFDLGAGPARADREAWLAQRLGAEGR
jgi:pimeloyl-ACP methyl ester carboxylesterase